MTFPLFDIIGTVADKIFPDKTKALEFKGEMERLRQEGEFKELDAAVSIMVMEAQSKDPWTSRARPSFLYVMYIFILTSIPMGVLFAFKPEVAGGVTEGVGLWLAAIPGEMWALFGAGYLGYVKKRSDDKKSLVEAKENNNILSKISNLF